MSEKNAKPSSIPLKKLAMSLINFLHWHKTKISTIIRLSGAPSQGNSVYSRGHAPVA